MKRGILILLSHVLCVNVLNYLNVSTKEFLFFTVALSIVCWILIERNIIRKIRDETEEDYLTALKNKRAYSQKKQFLNSCDSIGVMFLDVNNLKITNDTYGHEAGDELITSVASVIKKHTRDNTLSFRFGGDEFVMIFTNVTKERFMHFKEALLKDFSKLNLNLSPLEVSVAVGHSYKIGQIDIEKVLKEADSDMYETKREMKTKE